MVLKLFAAFIRPVLDTDPVGLTAIVGATAKDRRPHHTTATGNCRLRAITNFGVSRLHFSDIDRNK
jgi:hypothetical protein